MIAVLNTTPLNYLLQIGHADLLPQLYGRVLVPGAVQQELTHPRAPELVRAWATAPSAWLEVVSVAVLPDPALAALHLGEREALALAQEVGADLLVIDERAARQEAQRRGLKVTGTLGVLDTAAARGFLDLRSALERLQQTSFHISAALLQSFLERNTLRIPDPKPELDLEP